MCLKFVCQSHFKIRYAWALEQEDNARRKFEEQDCFVPWHLSSRFREEALTERKLAGDSNTQDGAEADESEKKQANESAVPGMKSTSDNDAAQLTMGVKDRDCGDRSSEKHHEVYDPVRRAMVFQRYCHVYMEGELEELAAKVPFAAVVDCFYDHANWCIRLKKLQSHD